MSMIHIKIPIWLDIIFAWPVMVWRQLKFGYTYRRIYLGEGEWTIVDRRYYYRFGNFKWCIRGNRNTFYAVRFVKTGPGTDKACEFAQRNYGLALRAFWLTIETATAWTIAGPISDWRRILRTLVTAEGTNPKPHHGS